MALAPSASRWGTCPKLALIPALWALNTVGLGCRVKVPAVMSSTPAPWEATCLHESPNSQVGAVQTPLNQVRCQQPTYALGRCARQSRFGWPPQNRHRWPAHHHGQLVDLVKEPASSLCTRCKSWFTARRRPRPICCSLVICELLGASLHRVNTLGLSQPFLQRPHREDENASRCQSRKSSFSFSCKMSLMASSSPFSLCERASSLPLGTLPMSAAALRFRYAR